MRTSNQAEIDALLSSVAELPIPTAECSRYVAEGEARTALERLAELAEAYREADAAYQLMGFTNANDMTVAQQVAFDLDYDRAYDVRSKAQYLYARARKEYADTGKVTL